MSDAELLTEAIDSGLSGRRPLEEELAEYERRRNEAAGPMYDYTCQLAALEPPQPETQRLFSALRGNREEINSFLGTIAGTTSIPGFYAPENVQRIAGRASQGHAASSQQRQNVVSRRLP